MKTVFICTPAYGQMVTTHYVNSLLGLLVGKGEPKEAVKFRFWIGGGDSLIPRARNLLAKRFLESDATHMLFVDADIRFHASEVYAMLASGHRLVAAAYPAKDLDTAKIIDAAKSGHQDPLRRGTRMVANFSETGEVDGVNGCVRVRDLPTGFMLIHRSVFEDMIKAFPDMEYTNDGDKQEQLWDFFFTGIHEEEGTRRYLSEDYGFCRRWQAMGGEAWLYLGADLGHFGGFMYEHDISAEVGKAEEKETAAAE